MPTVRPSIRGLTSLLGAVLLLGTWTASARAQTVVLQRAEPGSSTELTLNGTVMASGVTQPGGDATMRMTVTDRPDRWQTTVAVVIDQCGTTRRVHLVERDRGVAPPAGACARDLIEGYFLLQQATSMLVDVGNDPPTLRLRQGRLPSAWLSRDAVASEAPADQSAIYVFGGGAYRSIQAPIDRACGIATVCDGSSGGWALNGGAGFWIVPYFAVQGDYTHIPAFDIDGSGQNFEFTSTFGADLLTVSGLFGYPVGGHFRPYGRVGATHHRAVFTTTQINDPTTVLIPTTVDTPDGPQTVLTEDTDPGGTQEYGLETEGWGWLVAGGVEMWPTSWFGIYGEMAWTFLRGESTEGPAVSTDDKLTMIVFGVRVRLGP
jgi:hypothetical protein